MAYTGKKPIDHTDVTQSQSMAVTDDLTVDTDTLHVDSTNNKVGIGTTSPSAPFHIHEASSNSAYMRISNDTTGSTAGNGFEIAIDSSERPYLWNYENTDMYFGTNNSERMRIDSSGRLLVGTTSTNLASGGYAFYTGSVDFQMIGHASGVTTGNYYIGFSYNGSTIGAITQNGTTGVSYNTSSDYRLKENVTDITDGIERVKQLNPSRFNFIADADTTVDGFLAHEAATVVPEAVTGEKDAMRDEEYEVTPAVLDDDGNVVTEAVIETRSVPDYQGIDQAKLVPLLTAALQEAITKIETLETKVAALEAE